MQLSVPIFTSIIVNNGIKREVEVNELYLKMKQLNSTVKEKMNNISGLTLKSDA